MLSYFSEIGYKAYHLRNDKLINCNKLTLAEIASSDILFVPQKRMKEIEKFMFE